MTDPGYVVPGPHVWSRTDSDNLDKITKAQAVIAGLLGVAVILLAVGLVLGILGYNNISDKLDNIENSTAHTATNTVGVAP